MIKQKVMMERKSHRIMDEGIQCKALFIASLSLFCIVLAGCENFKEDIVGSWYLAGDETPQIIFYDDGTCESQGQSSAGQWSIVNGNTLKISDFWGQTETAEIISIKGGILAIEKNGERASLYNKPHEKRREKPSRTNNEVEDDADGDLYYEEELRGEYNHQLETSDLDEYDYQSPAQEQDDALSQEDDKTVVDDSGVIEQKTETFTESEEEDAEIKDYDRVFEINNYEDVVSYARTCYYGLKENLNDFDKKGNMLYRKGKLRRAVAYPDEWAQSGGTEEYYYDSEENLIFVYIYSRGKEYRYYFYQGNLYRYIDPSGNIKDFEYGIVPSAVENGDAFWKKGQDLLTQNRIR